MKTSTKIFFAVAVVFIVLAVWHYAKQQKQSREQAMENEQKTGSEIMDSGNSREVEKTEVDYFAGVKGYFVSPKDKGDYPGVVMMHEWWGLNGNIKKSAEMLAREGYMVLAVDLYHGNVAVTTEDAQKYVGDLNEAEAVSNMQAAVNFLKNKGATRIASLGWCFGGGQSLQLALSGEPLDATVIYYGSLVTEKDQLSKIQWPILGIFGDNDTSIPVAKVNEFDAVLNEISLPHEIHIYPGVGHAFANPSGANYAPEATKDAWGKTLAFLEKNLK